MGFPLTDSIVVLFLFYQFFLGWQKGLLETLIGPISLIVASAYAYSDYLKNHDFIRSLVISIALPFIIQIIYSLLKLFLRKKDDDKKKKIYPQLSRFIAGGIHTLWSLTIVVLIMFVAAYMPTSSGWMQKTKDDIMHSKIYELTNHCLGNRLPSLTENKNAKETLTFENPAQWIQTFQSTDEYKKLMQDPRIQAIVGDETIQESIKNNNFMQLLKNPKVQSIAQDPKLLEQLMNINSRLIEMKNKMGQ